MTEFQIFKACFPQLIIDEQSFSRLAFGEGVQLFREEGGFATVRGNCIELLCVAPEYQRSGIGTRLLGQCESCISADVIRLSGSMLPGAAEGSGDFFRSHGYRVEGLYNEMSLELDGFIAPDYAAPEGAQFCFYSGDIGEMRRAVAQVDEDWVQYFSEDEVLYVCLMNGEIASFCIVGEDETCLLSDGKQIGSIGCVGTVPKFRRQGLGLQMVAFGSAHLRNIGCERVFIHYTHLDKWYGRLGAEVFLRFSPAEKTV